MKVSSLLVAFVAIAIVAALALSGCAAKPIPVNREVVHDALIPVAAPCVNGERPARVVPLRERMTEAQWQALQVQQKIALAGLNALGLLKQVEDLGAATAACP